MACLMEQFLWVWVKRMLQPFYAPIQPYNITAFDWTETHWCQMAQQSKFAEQRRLEALQAEMAEQTRVAAEKLDCAKRQDDKDIGTFEL